MAEAPPQQDYQHWTILAQNIRETVNALLLRENITNEEYEYIMDLHNMIPDKVGAYGSFGGAGQINFDLRKLSDKRIGQPMDIELPGLQLAHPEIQMPMQQPQIYNIAQRLQLQYEEIVGIVLQNNTSQEINTAIQRMTGIYNEIIQNEAGYIAIINALPDDAIKIQANNYIKERINYIKKKYSYFKALFMRVALRMHEPLVYLRTLLNKDIIGASIVRDIRPININGVQKVPICNGNLWAFVRDIYVRNSISNLHTNIPAERNAMMAFFVKSIIQNESVGEFALDTTNNDNPTSLALSSYGVVIDEITFKPGTEIIRRHLNQPNVEPQRIGPQADSQYFAESIPDINATPHEVIHVNQQQNNNYTTRGGLYIACRIVDIIPRNQQGPNNLQLPLLTPYFPGYNPQTATPAQRAAHNAAQRSIAATALVPQLAYTHTRNLAPVSIVHGLHISIHGEDLNIGNQSHIRFKMFNDVQEYSLEINFMLAITEDREEKIIICSNLGEGSILQISNQLVQIIFNRYQQIIQVNQLPQADQVIFGNQQTLYLHKYALRNGFYQFLSGLETYLTQLRTTDPNRLPLGQISNMRIMSSIKSPFTTYIHYNKYLKYKSKYLKLKEMMNKKKLKI
jgi:hypothetical protein